jgi:hypothetical protein
MFNHKHFLAAVTFVLMCVSLSCFAETGSYKVSATLLHNDRPFASPTVIVKPGVPAEITVSGNNGYTLSLTVTELSDNKVKVSSKLNSMQYGDTSPVVIVRLGQPATVEVGKAGSTMGLRLTVTRTGS